MYRKCLKQRLAHGKYPEMLARIIITTTTIILCYFPIQLRKEGDMDSKKCNPSTMRMLKFISWVGGETKAQKGSVRGRPTAPFRVHEKEAPGLTARQEHRVDSSPCSPPRPGDLFSQLLAQLSQDGPTSRPPNKEVSLLREHDLHHTVTAYIRWDSIWKVPLKFEGRGCQHKWLRPPYSTLFQEAKRPEIGIRRGWRTALTLLFQNVCRWQKKIKLFPHVTERSVLQCSQEERKMSTTTYDSHAQEPVIVYLERLMKKCLDTRSSFYWKLMGDIGVSVLENTYATVETPGKLKWSPALPSSVCSSPTWARPFLSSCSPCSPLRVHPCEIPSALWLGLFQI